MELGREEREELFAHVQAERRLATCEVRRGRLVACGFARRPETDGDLDDDDRFDHERHQRDDVVTEDGDACRRKEEDVRTDRAQKRSQQTGAAPAVPRRDDHRGRKKDEGVIRAEIVEEILDPERDTDRRDGRAVAEKDFPPHAARRIAPSLAKVRANDGSIQGARLMSEELVLWHDFNVALVTAAAGLLGLLFVALSIHIRALNDRRNAELRSVARTVFLGYVVALAFGFFALLPQSLVAFGLELIGLNLVGLVFFAGAARSGLRATGVGFDRRVTMGQFAAGFVLIAVSLTGAIGVTVGETWAIYLTAGIAILSLLWGVFNTWELIFRMQNAGGPAD